MGEKEDPRQARRLKLSQVALQDIIGSQNDSKLANMLYGTQVSTSKNLVAARTIRHSIKDNTAFLDDKIAIPLTGNLPAIGPAAIRMNRTSALSGFGVGGDATPLRASKPFATATSKFNI